MLRRRLLLPILLLLAAAGIGAAVYAQLETGDRGILPLDTSNTLQVSGVHVDVTAEDSDTARLNGWRMAQRLGFRALWAKAHNAPANQAPLPPDSTLDQIVSSINVDNEEIGPNRYIADLTVEFDRAKAAGLLGMGGSEVAERSVPMLLFPVMVSGGTQTSVEYRNQWQRAWAEFRTAGSPISYVRVSGLGADPLLINAAQTSRPGRGWWRALLDMYGAQDVLVAEVQLQRAYPGGPARARFIGRHGPDGEIVGGFTLTASNSEALQRMLAEGVQRLDALFTRALVAGELTRDPSLNLPPPPVIPELETEVEKPTAGVKPVETARAFQVQISGRDVTVYNFAMAHLRTVGGVESASPQQINPGGTSYVLISYKGDVGQLVSSLRARGWIVDASGTVITIRSGSDRPPALPPPPSQPQPQAPPPPQPTQPASPVTNQTGTRQ
ncbi:MAG TPA: heavy-metal-associated domain-containing protein [Sphingomicrobium sp.]|jgi:hypothetical protein